MYYKILLFSFAFFTVINCQSQKLVKESSSKNLSQENLIYLKEGETKFLKDQQMNVTFVGIAADSRCPEGVNCIWQGAATASVTIMTTTSRPMQMELSTVNMLSRKMSKTQNVGEYHVTLEKVSPYPNQKNNAVTLKGQYQIGLKIEREIYLKLKIRLPLNKFLIFFS
ncbi:hypothetical protein [Halpernia sp. GG3]